LTNKAICHIINIANFFETANLEYFISVFLKQVAIAVVAK